MMHNSTFHALVQNFFLKRLMQQRNLSGNTVSSYRDTFKLYIMFLQTEHGVKSEKIAMVHMSAEFVEGFCQYLIQKRGCSSATVNNRLAALKSFLKFALEQAPEHSDTIRQALIIPFRKQEKSVMCFITRNEFDAYIAQCDTNTAIGARDKLMLLLLYNTGVRVSELLSIRYSDIRNLYDSSNASIRIYGKGRKERTVPLWKTTAKYIQQYTESLNISGNDKLFLNKNGSPLTRSGVTSRIEKLSQLATSQAPTLQEKNITPHSFRHSVAMNLLQSGVDISTIAIWLGHSSIETTHKYMVADLDLKRKAMESVGDCGNKTYNYKPSKGILEFLKSL